MQLYFIVLVECSYNGQCIPEGSSVFDQKDCTKRTCTLTTKGKGKQKIIIMVMEISDASK